MHKKLKKKGSGMSKPLHTFTSVEVLSVPPYSCWILVIPVDSGGILVEFTSQNFIPAMKLCNSGIYTGMVPGVWSPEWHRNPVTGIEICEFLGHLHSLVTITQQLSYSVMSKLEVRGYAHLRIR